MQQFWCLSKVDIFQDLSTDELADIGTRTPRQTVDAGTIFYSPEQSVEVLFILKEGRVRIFRISPTGKVLTTAMLNPGDIFGEMALFGLHMHDQFAEAMEPSTICLMSREDVLQLLQDPRIATRVAETLGNRLTQMEQRLSDFVFKNTTQRITNALLFLQRSEQQQHSVTASDHPCEIHYTHEQLAEFVGTYRETITKVLNELRDQGLVELRRGKILLRNIPALETLAER